MDVSYPTKSVEQKVRHGRRLHVRRHGDHSKKCMVWRHTKSGAVQLKPFRAPQKYQRVGVEAAAIAKDDREFVRIERGIDADGVYHSESDDSVTYIEGVPVYAA